MNAKAKSCEKCLWAYKCGDGEPCEDYTPLDDNGDYEMAAEEYEEDLNMRHELYKGLVREQDA